MKIGLIVEGDSDKAFFDDYFMEKFGFTKRNLLVYTSGKKKGNCNITKKQTKASLEPLKGSINSLKEKIEAEEKLSNLLTMIAAIVKIVAAAIAVAAV